MQRLAIIGGTGLLNMATGQPFADAGIEVLSTDSFEVETPYGNVPLKSFRLQYGSQEKTLVFLQRHHNEGKSNKPPHNINHHANVWALKHANMDAVLSVCSVGCVVEDFPPGRVGLANQYIDFTGQTTTFHDEEAEFTSVTEPFDSGDECFIGSRFENRIKVWWMNPFSSPTGWPRALNLKQLQKFLQSKNSAAMSLV